MRESLPWLMRTARRMVEVSVELARARHWQFRSYASTPAPETCDSGPVISALLTFPHSRRRETWGNSGTQSSQTCLCVACSSPLWAHLICSACTLAIKHSWCPGSRFWTLHRKKKINKVNLHMPCGIVGNRISYHFAAYTNDIREFLSLSSFTIM